MGQAPPQEVVRVVALVDSGVGTCVPTGHQPSSVAGSSRESPVQGGEIECSSGLLDRSCSRGLDGTCQGTFVTRRTSAIAIFSQLLPNGLANHTAVD